MPDLPKRLCRTVLRTAGAVVAVFAVTLAILPAGVAAAATPRTTIVSLTFDDSNADQLTAAATMQALGLRGTFYAIPGSIGTPGYLTLPQLQQLYRSGNEIGGHTVNHPDLTQVPADEAQRQVCLARNTLTGWGFPQASFAYPYASVDSSVEAVVRACGYNSARGLGDIRSRFGCPDCAYAETVPPADRYDLAALDEVDSTWTLADLTGAVTKAESRGGWLIITFHHVCAGSGCDPLSISPQLFAQFATWLAVHDRTRPSTSVRTVGQVIGGTISPTVTPPAPPATAGAITNASLETSLPDGSVSCWTGYQWGSNSATFATVPDAHTGSAAENIAISDYSSGAAGFYPTFDTGGCTPSATPGHTYTVSAWYKSTTVVQFVVYYRNPEGGFSYWTSGPYIPSSSTWAQAIWTTPALPAGASGISFGLSIFGNGSLTVDDFTYADSASLPPPVPQTAMGNASLETAGINAMPQCWTPSTFGANDASYTASSPGHSGDTAVTVTITQYTDGAGQLLPTLYGSTCAPEGTPGQSYSLSAWYQSTAITQFIVYYQTADGTWNYWTASPWLAPESSWTQAAWTTPPLPSGATRVAFGLSLFSTGSLTTDDYGFAAT